MKIIFEQYGAAVIYAIAGTSLSGMFLLLLIAVSSFKNPKYFIKGENNHEKNKNYTFNSFNIIFNYCKNI